MCEYCGCQSLPAIAELTREHDRVVDLVGDVRTAHHAGDLDLVIELSRRIAAILAPHTAVEEQGLFPPMAAGFPDQIAVLQTEHRQIEAVLAGAFDGAARTDPTWPQRLLDVLALLRRHILKEQDGVFPAALSTLSNEQWQRLDELRQAHNASSPVPQEIGRSIP